MIAELIDRLFLRRTPGGKPLPRRTRLQLEALESRWVPAAVRNLPGITTTLAANDDGSSPAVNIGFNLNFFNANFSQLFVNNNGNVTFGSAQSNFTPTALNGANGGRAIIAA